MAVTDTGFCTFADEYSSDSILNIDTAPSAMTGKVPVVIDGVLCIPRDSFTSGGTAAVYLRGVLTMPKKTSLAINGGDYVYWDVTNLYVTKTTTDFGPIGIARIGVDYGASATILDVQLDPVLAKIDAAAAAYADARVSLLYSATVAGKDSTSADVKTAPTVKHATITAQAGDKIVEARAVVTTGTLCGGLAVIGTAFAELLVDDGGTIKVNQLMAAGNLTANTYELLIARY